MSKTKKSPKPGSRAARREKDRETVKLARDVERLWLLEPGGSAERAVPIESPSEVEVRARSMPCPRCGGAQKVEDHTAETVGGRRVRVAAVACAACGARRSIYFQLPGALLN